MITKVVMFATVAIVLASIGIFTRNYAMLIGLIFLVMAWQAYKDMTAWVENSSKIRFGFDGSYLLISGSEFENKLLLSSVKKLVIQIRRKEPVSVLLYPASGSLEKLEGIKDMQSFVSDIKSIIGDSKVKYARFFHR